MNNIINLNLGLETFNINDSCEVSFNPTDLNFASKFLEIFEQLEAEQQAYAKKATEKMSTKQVFDEAKNLDMKIRESLNGLFGKDICTPIFGNINVYAIADGIPVWIALMLSLMDIITNRIEKMPTNVNDKILKFTQKYRKR